MQDSEVAEVIHLPKQCVVVLDDETRCQSRNAIWDDAYQGEICFVHKAQLDKAKKRHPAGKALPATRPLMVRECSDPDCRRCR